MGEAPSIRRGVPADAHALAELGQVVVPATYLPISRLESERTLRTWWSELTIAGSMKDYQHWVAETADGELVGITNLGTRTGRNVMWKLYVHPHHQGEGLGSALLGEVVAATAGEPLWLSHVAGNDRAQRFYEHHGFVEQHRESDPPYPDQVWMRRDDG
jgi:ribosomal protein S18 acetylase RimI-like enzyme